MPPAILRGYHRASIRAAKNFILDAPFCLGGQPCLISIPMPFASPTVISLTAASASKLLPSKQGAGAAPYKRAVIRNHPGLLPKLYIYGYLNRIQSCRRRRAAGSDLPAWRLAGNSRPAIGRGRSAPYLFSSRARLDVGLTLFLLDGGLRTVVILSR